jgi:hypothetical protein
MFFHISEQPQENYPCQWQLDSFAISTDNGWKHMAIGPVQILYKGYADLGPLETLLGQVMFQSIPHLAGNFCALVVVNNTLTIQTDRCRGFPIYIDSTGINNLVGTDRIAWTDSLVTVHADLTVTENKFDVIGEIDIAPVSFRQAQDKIHDILTRKTQQFLSHNILPLRSFLSGGVDTLLVYSYLRASGAEFELIDYNHVDHDYFWRANTQHLNKFWGYNQTHHWKQSCVLASGAPGDEFMLRSPTTANLYLLYHGTSIPTLLEQNTSCLHHTYFSLSKHQKLFDSQKSPSGSTEQLHHSLCDIVANDWQHWHLGETLHWTPLRDLEIFKILMRLSVPDAIDQIMDSSLSRALIERNVPGATELISDQKNTEPILKNLNRLFG